MGPKKKATKAAPTPGTAAAAGAGATEETPAVTFTPAEAKKLAKLLKASDRGKRLDAIRVVSENHGYISTGGCLLPLLESVVAKKKTEEVVRAASQVIVDYLVGRDAGADPTLPSDTAMAALKEAKKKPAKYKLAEVLASLVLNPDPENSWNAVRSVRSIAATVDSLPQDSPQAASLGAMLLGPGQPADRLCSYLVAQETKTGDAGGGDSVVPWPEVRLHIMDTIGVMCKVSNEAIQTVVSTGAVRCVLGLLRSITESDTPDMLLLTSTLVILFAVAKVGGGGIAPPAGTAGGDNASILSSDVAAAAAGGGVSVSVSGGGAMSPELTALAEGGAWGAVYDALKGPCMARATELQQANAAVGGGKKGGEDAATVSADLTACLDNMARCAEVLRVMAMTGAGLEEEGALEAGVAAMSSILGMSGLPREQAAVANLMTGMVKAMGSIACLSESNRVKVCSAGAAEKVLALMAPPDLSAPSGTAAAAATAGGGTSSPPDTPHGRLMRKTAEKCLHHLVVSRVTWMADDRALCDTGAPPPGEPEDALLATTDEAAAAGGDHERDAATAEKRGRTRSTSGGSNRSNHPPPALGPAYLTVDDLLAASNADSIDVRCRAIRLLSRLMSSPRCAAALGVSAIPVLGRFIGWWLRTKDDPEAHRTPRPAEPTPPEGGIGKSAAGGGKKGAGGKAAAKEAAAAAAAAEAAKDEQAAENKAAEAAAARIAAKRLEELDSTRVLRDEALAYALTVMLKLAETGSDERAAIGENAIVELLASVLKRLPCTLEEFYANSGEQRRPTTSMAVASTASSTSAPTSTSAATASATESLPMSVNKMAAKAAEEGDGASHHAPSHAAGGGLSDPRPDTTLDLSLAHRRPSSSNNPRKFCCWRGEKSRDPEVLLFSPLDWGWDFEVGVSQEPIQPGLVIRAAVLRVLLAVVDGYDPAVEGASAVEAAAAVPVTTSKGGAGAAAAAEAAAKAAVLSGGNGARSVLNHVLPMCLDLLSVDVRHRNGGNDGVAGEGCDGNGSSRHHKQGGARGEAVTSPPQQQNCIHAAGGKPANNRLTVELLSGRPVSPAEELVHEEIRVACLRLLGSLLRLGGPAREALLSVAAIHRDGGFTHLEEESDVSCNKPDGTAPTDIKSASTTIDKAAVTKNAGGGEAGGEASSWDRPESFRSWNLHGEGDLSSLRQSLPYVRTLSAVMLPLRNPDSPVTDIVAALVALKRLCRENEHEAGGTQPEPHTPPAENDEIPPLPSSREGTAGVLVDTLAGVAVSLGALVPLVSIWGCALAAAGSAVELAPEITGMVSECQGLIDYLIRRGHARESFWSSLPSLEQIDEAKAAAAEAAAPKKAPRKSKGSAGKPGKGGGKGSREPSTAALEIENDENPDVPKTPERPAGRPDPNLGPGRAGWGELLNARVDERRTQTCGTTALLMAAATGLETAVSNLLLAGADPNVRGNDGRSPLMCALAQGMDEAARGLVEAGADVDAINLEGYSVLRCAFLCPSRQAMRDVMRKRPGTGAEVVASRPLGSASSGRTGLPSSAGSGRRGSATSLDGGSNNGRVGRRGSTSRSVSRSRSRSRSGSLTRDRRRSSLSRSISFGEDAFVIDTGAAAAAAGSSHRRLSRMASMSALDSARAALRDSARRESAQPLKTPRGTTVVRGDARMVPYMLECGADPNVSSGTGDFPLHWAVTGTELTVRIMNQQIKIVAGGGVGGGIGGVGGAGGVGSAQTDIAAASEDCTSSNANGTTVAATSAEGDQGAEEHQEDLALLKVLVGAGSALDACNPEGMTALHAAVIASRGTLAGALLDAGASPNYSDALGCLPLHYACLRANAGYAELASRLLALGMGRPLDKGVHRDLRKGKTRREKLLLDVADIMHRGLREATEPSCITQHRATRSELLNFVSAEGFTPLHYVCDGRVAGRHAAAAVLARWQERAPVPAAPGLPLIGGGGGGGGGGRSADVNTDEGLLLPNDDSVDRVKILLWLLSEPALDPKVRVPRGATTLHMAAAVPGSQGADLVRSLIQAGGVNLDALDSPAAATCSSRSGNGYGFGQVCVTNTPDEAEGGGQEMMPQLRFSALHCALQAGSWESANLLLSAGSSVGPEGAFPPCLHVACVASAPASLVEMLLERDHRLSGTTVSGAEAGPYGASPLFLAAAAGSADLVDLLLPGRGKFSGTPQTLDDIAEDETATLIGAGGDDGGPSPGGAGADGLGNIWTMMHSPSDGRSPLHAAAAGGHTAAARALLNAEPELAAATAASGGSSSRSWLNTPDTAGNTPLDVAVSEGHWECAERLAAAAPFDVRLAVEKGPSSALIIVERANMAIVDEGKGDASTLCALRESNTLVMTLLKRLHDDAAAENSAAVAAAAEAAAAAAATATATASPVSQDPAHTTTATDSAAPPPEDEDDKELGTKPQQLASGAGAVSRSPPSPVVHHLHPCFAEGVLYSNAKGVFVPDTPERRRKRRSSRQQQQQQQGGNSAIDDDQNRAAVIIQSRARQAGAKRAVAEKKKLGSRSSSNKTRRISSSSGGRRSWSDTTDQERAAVVIQAQARQARARAETARRREKQKQQQQQQQQQRRRSSKHMGEVGVVVVKAAG